MRLELLLQSPVNRRNVFCRQVRILPQLWYNFRMGSGVEIDGCALAGFCMGKVELRRAARYFADRSAARIGVPFRSVAVVLQRDDESAAVHESVC